MAETMHDDLPAEHELPQVIVGDRAEWLAGLGGVDAGEPHLVFAAAVV